jgi:hypothetical protein
MEQSVLKSQGLKISEVALQLDNLSWARSLYCKIDTIRIPFIGTGRLNATEKKLALMAIADYMRHALTLIETKIAKLQGVTPSEMAAHKAAEAAGIVLLAHEMYEGEQDGA